MKNLENQRSINTQTLKILRIRISETMQIVSEFIRSKDKRTEQKPSLSFEREELKERNLLHFIR